MLLISGFPRQHKKFVNGEAEIARDLMRTLLSKSYTLVELAATVRRALDS